MSVVVTGATGHLGRLAVESLLARGVPAADITATGRSTEGLADLAARGVRVAVADFQDPATLDAAFAGAEKLLLVSSGSFDDRAGQHRNAIDAAVRAGVRARRLHLGPEGDDLAPAPHGRPRAPPRRRSPRPASPTPCCATAGTSRTTPARSTTYLEHGMVGAAGDGKVSIAPRSDYAEAAAVVLTTDGHEGKVYELGGEALTLAEIAALISTETGREIAYTDVPVETLTGILVGAGFPEPVAAVFADVDRGISEGELLVDPTDLATLLGRPATPAAIAVKAALAS